MITRIARKEFTDLLRDGRFRFSAVLIGSLLLVSLGAGWLNVRDARAQLEAAQATARDHWESQGEKNPHSAAHYGIYAFKPRLPLAFVDQGVDPWTGTSVWLKAHRQNDFLMRPAQDATAAQRFGALTAAGVLQHLVPLLIILLGFGALAGEREKGQAGGVIDSRALAYALNGRLAEAAADFRTALADGTYTWPNDEQRAGWAEALERGENPFELEALATLAF